MLLLPSLYFQVIFSHFQNRDLVLKLCRSAISDLHHLHDQGDVVEVGVGQGGQEADAPTD